MHAIVLGSGLNDFSNNFEQTKEVSFKSVLDVPFEELDGHDRKFIWCRYESIDFVVISGKFHFYEGHDFNALISPFKYVVEELGVDKILVTSASGGLSENIEVGELAYLEKVISVPEVDLGDGFEMEEGVLEEDELRNKELRKLSRATYAYHQGPSLGSVSEYKI